MPGLPTLQFLALVLLLVVAVYADVRDRRIPNRITVPGLLVGLALGALLEGGIPLGALGGAGLALLVSFPLVALGGLGAGDAKLLTAVGAYLGPGGLLPLLVYGGLAGGLMATGNAIRRGAILGLLANLGGLVLHWITRGNRGYKVSLTDPGAHSIPYGVAISAGALLAWFFPFSLAV
jgi:prepilin peptidase CpaA